MVNGAIGMAFSTVTKLFLMIGMTNLNLPKDAEEGDLFLDPCLLYTSPSPRDQRG